MTREEFIKCDEYIKTTIEIYVRSKKSVKKIREELTEFFLEYRDELLNLQQTKSIVNERGYDIGVWVKTEDRMPNKYPVCVRSDGGGAWFYETVVDIIDFKPEHVEWLDKFYPNPFA